MINNKKKLFTILCACFVMTISLACIIANRKVTSYPYVFVNDHYYYVTNEPADESQMDRSVDTVRRITEIDSKNVNGDSNCLAIDSSIYSVKGSEENEDAPLIVTTGHGKYVMAYRYHYEEDAP